MYYNEARDKMSCKNLAYEFFKVNELSFGVPLIKTKWRDGESDNSLTIAVSDKAGLERLFNTTISDKHWKREYQREGERLFTLHSSALASLLCFHSISSEKPLPISIDNEFLLFDEVEFEHENRCFNHPSCIDVTLKNEATRHILFLECKFSEYLHNGKASKISPQYHPYYEKYKKVLPKELVFEGMEDASASKTITTKSGRCNHYCEGIKQMLSHHIGACNSVKDKYNGYTIYLGSIVFDFSHCGHSSIANARKMEKSMKDYSNLYQQLATGLNSISSDVVMLSNLLTYQDLFHNNPNLLSDRIKEFYHLY